MTKRKRQYEEDVCPNCGLGYEFLEYGDWDFPDANLECVKITCECGIVFTQHYKVVYTHTELEVTP